MRRARMQQSPVAGLGLLTAVAALGGLIWAASGAGAAPERCTIEVNGPTTTVSWAVDPDADMYVVSRSIDDGPTWWRGRTADTSFDDSSRAGASYIVQSRASDGSKGPSVPCEPAPPTPVDFSCSVVIGADRVDVAWSDVTTDRFVIRRSVNGGTAWWRGRTTGEIRAFTDSPRDAQLDYSVSYRLGDMSLSEPTPCVEENEPDRGPHLDAVAFGDMVSCGVPGPEQVAALVDTLPGFILGLGDFSQEEGTIEQFENCFDPIMGRHTPRIEPVPGNHEYRTPNAAGYFEYFGTAAGDPDKGYYERTKGKWQILYINSSCWEVGGCEYGAPQQDWLAEVLDGADPAACRIAIMHHPRWSSWGPYASQAGLDPVYTLLHQAGTDLILTGHAHHYERLSKLAPDGTLDPIGGFRQITVGTGGTAPRFPDVGDVLDEAAVLITGTWGVLDLDLYDDSYDWRFVSVDGDVLDAGTDTCGN
jgi:hypothetical protein